MASDVAICNQALAAVGTRSTIASLTENSNEARNCNLFYADTRDEILQMAHWGFATKTLSLALLKSAPGTPTNQVGQQFWTPALPPPPWLFEYAYPSDCLLMRSIIPQLPGYALGIPIFTGLPVAAPVTGPAGVPFEIVADTDSNDNAITAIVTNQYLAIGQYTMRVTDPNRFPKLFSDALSYALAAKLSMPLAGKKSLVEINYNLANESIKQARASTANESLTIIDNMPDWITCREDYSPGLNFSGYIAPFNPLYGF